MRVCQVTSLHPPFDVRIFHKECLTLRQAGYEVTLLAQAGWAERVVDGVRVIGLPQITARRQRPLVWRHIIRQVRRLKPSIVHFHDPELLLLFPFLRPAHLIYDCQEPFAETVLVRRWIPRLLRRPASRLVAALEPWLARRTDAIVITVDSHAERFRSGATPTVPVHNYPLLEQFDYVHRSDGRTVLHVGVLSEGRGSLTMIEAMAAVVRSLRGARLLLVGPFDSAADEAELRQLIVEFGLQQAVQVVGWVPFTELPRWFAQADVGLVPWHSREEFPPPIVPTKMFEYMAARLPVVASDRPVIRALLQDRDCGLLVEPGDAGALAEAIEQLLTHPAEARAMGQRGREAVEQHYRWETEGEKLVRLYGQLG
jgi:glycosyltransferase involved in cell wall biosynthesis